MFAMNDDIGDIEQARGQVALSISTCDNPSARRGYCNCYDNSRRRLERFSTLEVSIKASTSRKMIRKIAILVVECVHDAMQYHNDTINFIRSY